MSPMLLSAFHAGYTVAMRGLADKEMLVAPGEQSWGRRLGWKLHRMADFVSTIAKDDVVLYVDAYDVIFVDPPNVVLDKFIDIMDRTGQTILISAEANKGFRSESHPATQSAWRYINSGVIIGLASGWNLLLKDLPPPFLPPRYVSDQDWLIDVYLNTTGLGGLMGIDWNCDLFQVACRVKPVESHASCMEDGIAIESGQVTNSITMTRPSVLHFPGRGHWGFKSSLTGADTCHYYEVLRTLLPDVAQQLEMQGEWLGPPSAW
eukprot:CAMPEP_0117506552 /NCGR_PEP_ID=MMETSP0784-20121206/25966_1 /TAXON_ID=39447 /ORGANISM="" /LENGTH=262 /DNA_ID=CAMNT_0005302027 /DNA_START=121 /DNA_END=906 /DNA_ORIENTATION=-